MAVIQISTLDQKLAVIRKRILNSNSSDFNVSPASEVSDLFITPQAVSDVQQNALTFLNAIALSITDLLALENDANNLALIATALNISVANVLTILSGLLDSWGRNFNTVRFQPTKAQGVVKYGTPTAPTSDLTVGIGKTVKSAGNQQYITTGSATLVAANAAQFFDPITGFFLLAVPVQAALAGSAGNASAGTVNTIVTSVQGFSFLTNTDPITGGNDLETDAAFGARLLLIWQAIGKLTQAGVKLSALLPSVTDVFVAKTGDPLSLRGSGKTDVWVEGQRPVQVTETFNAFNSPDFPMAIVPTNRPVISLDSVGSGTALLAADTQSALAHSVQSKDRFQFSANPTFPVQITYTYDGIVGDVQAVFNDPAASPLNQEIPVDSITAARTPILAKAALPVNINFTFSIAVVPGQNRATVVAAVQTALASFSQGFKLGQTVFKFDLVKVVENTPGVLRITTIQLFAIDGQTGVQDQISVGLNQFVRLKTVNIF